MRTRALHAAAVLASILANENARKTWSSLAYSPIDSRETLLLRSEFADYADLVYGH